MNSRFDQILGVFAAMAATFALFVAAGLLLFLTGAMVVGLWDWIGPPGLVIAGAVVFLFAQTSIWIHRSL